MSCPLCHGPHELSQCPRWRCPPDARPLAVAFLYLSAAPLQAFLAGWHLAARMGALL